MLANDELECEVADLQTGNRHVPAHPPHLAAQGRHCRDESGTTKIRRIGKKASRKNQTGFPARGPRAASGIIVSRQPESLLGKYLAEGSEVVLLGDENRKELRVAVDQDDSDSFFAQVGKPVWIRAGGNVFLNTLSQIEPRASLEPLHPALAATKGGPLPVQRKANESPDKKDESGPESYELLTPQFTGRGDITLGPKRFISGRPTRTGKFYSPRTIDGRFSFQSISTSGAAIKFALCEMRGLHNNFCPWLHVILSAAKNLVGATTCALPQRFFAVLRMTVILTLQYSWLIYELS